MNINEEILHIEGLDAFDDHDLSMENDTPPDAIIVWFDVVKEYMPFLSDQAGERVYQNFVHRFFIKELGHSSGNRRIKDTVHFDKERNEWRISKLATGGKSDIKKYAREWNSFQKGNTGAIIGTPIDMLFKHDPTRADMYKRNHIDSIERLAGLTEGDCQKGGMGWLDDKKRAMEFVRKTKDASAGIQMQAEIKRLETENAQLRNQVEGVNAKLDLILKQQAEALTEGKKGGKKNKDNEEVTA